MILKNKTALITGGATGIGREIALLFAKEGADLCIQYHSSRETALELQEKLTSQNNVKVTIVHADVSKEEDVRSMVQHAVDFLGKIDILVCSAGINHQVSVLEMKTEDWDRMIATNLRSIFLCDHYVLPYMLENKFGRIINVTSQLGQIGGVNSAHYAAAKAGIIGFTKSLAREISTQNVTANCIAPGPIATPFFYNGTTAQWREDKLRSLPLGRFGEACEVAPTALLLASDPGGNIYTGQTLGPNSGDVML